MTVATTWPWAALALLGAVHGLNPGMGWLFAVALGLQERNRRAVWGAVLPLAAGHALAIAAAIGVAAAVGVVLPTGSSGSWPPCSWASAWRGSAATAIPAGWGCASVRGTSRSGRS